MANSLRSLGLGKGDAIGVFMPMVPEIVVAMLAIIKIGGIFLPLFSGFGAAAIVSRLNDAEAKALFTAAGTYRRGKFCPMKPVADEAAAQIPTLRHLIVLNQAGEWLIEAVGSAVLSGHSWIRWGQRTLQQMTRRPSARRPKTR